jgi:hypothetical protein
MQVYFSSVVNQAIRSSSGYFSCNPPGLNSSKWNPIAPKAITLFFETVKFNINWSKITIPLHSSQTTASNYFCTSIFVLPYQKNNRTKLRYFFENYDFSPPKIMCLSFRRSFPLFNCSSAVLSYFSSSHRQRALPKLNYWVLSWNAPAVLWVTSVQKTDLPCVGLVRPPDPLFLLTLHASRICNVKYIYHY